MVSFAKVSTTPEPEKRVVHSGKAEADLPQSKGIVTGKAAHSSLLPGSSQTHVGRDKGQLIWLSLEQPSLSAFCCGPGPLLQSPPVRGSLGVLCAGYCPCRHVRWCDDKDLLWEALTSSPSNAHGAGSGCWPLGHLGLVTLSFSSPSWK